MSQLDGILRHVHPHCLFPMYVCVNKDTLAADVTVCSLLETLTLKVLVTTIDAQWEGGGCRVGKVRAGTTSPMPDHKGFKPQ